VFATAVAATLVTVMLVRATVSLHFFVTMFYGCNDKVELKIRYWWCRIAAVGFCQTLAVGSYIRRNSVLYRLLTVKIFSCSGTEGFFLQRCQKKSFLARCQKGYFFGGDEGVSNFKKSQTIHTTSSMTKSPSSKTKAAAATKKKTVKLDLFQSKFTKLWFLLYCMLSRGFVVCLPPPFLSLFFDEQHRHDCTVIV
jgi:hypothetical protein